MADILIPPEAEKVFTRAMEMWDETKSFGDLTDQEKSDIMAFLSLAIKKANGIYPVAQAKLSFFLYMEGKKKEAIAMADNALRYDQDAFTAQLVRVFNALDGLQVSKITPGSFFANGGGIEASVYASVFKTFGTLIGAGISAQTQKNCKNEIMLLIDIYRRICRTPIGGEDYIYYSNLMISIGDFIKDIPFAGGRPNLYLEVLNSPLNCVEIGEYEDGIDLLRMKAEGKADLFKPN